MLLIDNVKYELWIPPSEDALEQMVKEHAQDIFGEEAIYFDVKQKLKAKSGVGSIPDGYAIILADKPQWYIVEVELSSHPVFEHIVSQMHKFMAGVKNSRKEIVDTFHEEIIKNQLLKAMVESRTGSPEIYKFLDSLVSKLPKLAIIIEEETDELREAVDGLKLETEVVELKTFVKRGADISEHAHLFRPLETGQPGDPIVQFLEEVRKRFVERKPAIKPTKAFTRFCFIRMKGHKSVHTEWLFWRNGGLGVELHLERGSREENIRLFKKLESMKSELEKNIGQPLTFKEWGKRARVYVGKEPPVELKGELKEWAVETMIRFYDTFQPILDEIDP